MNYRIIVTYSEAQRAFLAQAPELPQCEAEGATRAEAITRLEEEMSAQVENMETQGVEIPRPIDDLQLDGNLPLKVSPVLHRDLAFLARLENVELETLLIELLTRGVSQRWGGGRGGPQRGAGREGGRPGRSMEGQGARYHNIMEDRANFIEYVRSLEQPGGGGGRPGPGGVGRGGRGPRGGGGDRR